MGDGPTWSPFFDCALGTVTKYVRLMRPPVTASELSDPKRWPNGQSQPSVAAACFCSCFFEQKTHIRCLGLGHWQPALLDHR